MILRPSQGRYAHTSQHGQLLESIQSTWHLRLPRVRWWAWSGEDVGYELWNPSIIPGPSSYRKLQSNRLTFHCTHCRAPPIFPQLRFLRDSNVRNFPGSPLSLSPTIRTRIFPQGHSAAQSKDIRIHTRHWCRLRSVAFSDISNLISAEPNYLGIFNSIGWISMSRCNILLNLLNLSCVGLDYVCLNLYQICFWILNFQS